MVSYFALVATMALASLASAQGPAHCTGDVQVCGTACCTGPVAAFGCDKGTCIPITNPALPSGSPSVTITIITTSPAGVPTETAAPNTTVSVPVVSPSETTVVETANVTSWSTTAFPTGNHTATGTGANHTQHATGTDASGKPEPSGAADAVRAGAGILGAALAAALAF